MVLESPSHTHLSVYTCTQLGIQVWSDVWQHCGTCSVPKPTGHQIILLRAVVIFSPNIYWVSLPPPSAAFALAEEVGLLTDWFEIWGFCSSSGGVGPENTRPHGVLGMPLNPRPHNMLPGGLALCVKLCHCFWREFRTSAQTSQPYIGSAVLLFPGPCPGLYFRSWSLAHSSRCLSQTSPLCSTAWSLFSLFHFFCLCLMWAFPVALTSLHGQPLPAKVGKLCFFRVAGLHVLT